MAKKTFQPATGLRAILRDERFWQIALQLFVLAIVVAMLSYFFGNFSRNNQSAFGFSFFKNPAGFAIGEDLINYSAQEPYAKIIQAGIINSSRVVIAGVILATVVGVTAGVASFSDNWLLKQISRVYVGLVRNVPLLLQLFFWYLAVFLAAPKEANQIVLPSQTLSWLIISNKGISLPGPGFSDELWVGLMLLVVSLLLLGLLWRSLTMFRQGRFAAGLAGWFSRLVNGAIIVAVLVVDYFLLFSNAENDGLYFKGALLALFSNAAGLWILTLMAIAIASVCLWRWRTKVMLQQGQDGKLGLGILLGLGVAALAILLFAFNWNAPVAGPNGGATGGMRLSMEYAAVLTGLTFYTGAFIAEIVRAGIQSVSRGQWEAARSLGLNNSQAMQLVVFPQSLRVIIPPLNSEFANLAKNSSLALAVGYPDLYSVSNTTFNTTGRPIEVFLVMMATYLTLNLLISLNMNQLNSAVQFKER
jgi:general L-amino acid transport system permease protein